MTKLSLEIKGLGAKLGETDIFGAGGDYHKYASLIEEDETNSYNVLIMDHPRTGDTMGVPTIKEGTYIFPEMVDEERARRRYDELR